MPADATTFTLAFTAVFGGIAVYLWWLDRKIRAMEDRVLAVEARDTKEKSSAGGEDP